MVTRLQLGLWLINMDSENISQCHVTRSLMKNHNKTFSQEENTEDKFTVVVFLLEPQSIADPFAVKPRGWKPA